ncbi:MAG TPA: LacI family DNA-binding transcriptional regulator [Euzebyales bacterium]|nr:LacI family DNA-binding transcriptional regulator [Euzebyales bacterium]
MKRPTIADIAKRAGVSTGAVSYALNGQPGVSEATRARILAIAEEVGWQPNSAARALSASRVNTVGLVVSRPASVLAIEPFFMQLISGIEAALSQRGTALLLQVSPSHEAEITVHRRWWGERRVDGVILIDLEVDDPRIDALAEMEMPAVAIGGPLGDDRISEVYSDEAAAMRILVDYLAALGHRRIAHVSGPKHLLHTRTRITACQAAAERHGLECADSHETDYTGEAAARTTRDLLSASVRPTAIIYDNDVMAVAAVAVTQEMGLSIPQDISLAAWEDSPLCQLVHPPLTTLHRDVMAYGTHAAQQLLATIEDGQRRSFEDSASYLVPRGSTARPSDGARPLPTS